MVNRIDIQSPSGDQELPFEIIDQSVSCHVATKHSCWLVLAFTYFCSFLTAMPDANAGYRGWTIESRQKEQKLRRQIETDKMISRKGDAIKWLADLYGYMDEHDNQINCWIQYIQLYQGSTADNSDKYLNLNIGFLGLGNAYHTMAYADSSFYQNVESAYKKALSLAETHVRVAPSELSYGRLLISRFHLADCYLDERKRVLARAVYDDIRNSSGKHRNGYLKHLDSKLNNPKWARSLKR